MNSAPTVTHGSYVATSSVNAGASSASAWDVRPGRSSMSLLQGTTLAMVVTAVSNIMAPVPTLGADHSATPQRYIAQPARTLSKRYWSAYKEMATFRNLSSGWDGPGSIAPLAGVIASALNFLFSLPEDLAVPEPTVSADGTAGWFWERDDLYASVFFMGGNRFAYFARNDESGQIVRGVGFFDQYIPADLVDMLRSA